MNQIKSEGYITLSDLSKALNNIKINTSPATDGFLNDLNNNNNNNNNSNNNNNRFICNAIMRSVNYSDKIRQLALVQRQGIITLLPKELNLDKL